MHMSIWRNTQKRAQDMAFHRRKCPVLTRIGLHERLRVTFWMRLFVLSTQKCGAAANATTAERIVALPYRTHTAIRRVHSAHGSSPRLVPSIDLADGTDTDRSSAATVFSRGAGRSSCYRAVGRRGGVFLSAPQRISCCCARLALTQGARRPRFGGMGGRHLVLRRSQDAWQPRRGDGRVSSR